MSIDRTVVVPLDADETFALLTEPAGLRRWQAITAHVDLRPGGDYRMLVVPGHTAAGSFVQVDPGKQLVYTWGWRESQQPPPGDSTITITLEPAERGTRVRLVHDGLTGEAVGPHDHGWEHYLKRLAEADEAGPDEWATAPQTQGRLDAAEASLAVCLAVMRGVRPEHGTLPTPCPKFTVDDLIAHLLKALTGLGRAVGADVPVPGDGPAEARLAAVAMPVLEAWRAHQLDGTVHIGPTELPAERAANILSLELLVHAWDLATATGQRLPAGEALCGYVLELCREVITPQARDGDAFAAEVPVGADATHLRRLVAFTGRAA